MPCSVGLAKASCFQMLFNPRMQSETAFALGNLEVVCHLDYSRGCSTTLLSLQKSSRSYCLMENFKIPKLYI